ncbi:hypothetical protein EFM7_0257 [Enterococcus faecalis M7]|nr:hypothetical protein EFM7_0257 [Enterococcus faecalis M7]
MIAAYFRLSSSSSNTREIISRTNPTKIGAITNDIKSFTNNTPPIEASCRINYIII